MRSLWTVLPLLFVLAACGASEVEGAIQDAGSTPAGSVPVEERSLIVVDEPPAPRRSIDQRLQEGVRAIVSKYVTKASGLNQKVTSSNVQVAVHVRERGVEGELVDLSADRAQKPASNMKLVTSAAALCLLGADWHFETRFSTDAEIVNGTLAGDLVVRAGGDPLYNREAQGSVDEWLRPLVRKLEAAGIRAIAGDLVLDERAFADPGPAPGWPAANQYWHDYCAFSAGFSANAGCLTVVISPGSVGGPAKIALEPQHHGLIERITVKTGKQRSRLDVALEGNRGTAIVRGALPADVASWEKSFSAGDPVELFGSVLEGALRAEGIELRGSRVRERGRSETATNGNGELRTLAVMRSPLRETLVPINTDSNNSVADQVLKVLGDEITGRGTFESGALAVKTALERLGVSSAGFVQVDGSGLSRDNRVSAAQLTTLIDAVMSLPDDAPTVFRESLAIGGETGTLKNRLKDSATRARVFAKTGWISGVSALSGIVLDGKQRELVFSILIEYPRVSGLNTACWKPMHNDICVLLAEFDG